MAILKLIIF